MENPAIKVVVLCTGNAARSPMAGVMLTQLGARAGVALEVRTGGTHVLEHQPMGMRTKMALESIGTLDLSQIGQHRSHQVTDEDCQWADLILVMEPSHLRYMRQVHPSAAAKTASLIRVAEELPADGRPVELRVESLELAALDLESEPEVVDPAGGDDDAYRSCAAELHRLCDLLVERLAGS